MWAIDLLIASLNIESDIIGLKTLSVIEEVTQDADNTSKFLEKVNLERLLYLCRIAES